MAAYYRGEYSYREGKAGPKPKIDFLEDLYNSGVPPPLKTGPHKEIGRRNWKSPTDRKKKEARRAAQGAAAARSGPGSVAAGSGSGSVAAGSGSGSVAARSGPRRVRAKQPRISQADLDAALDHAYNNDSGGGDDSDDSVQEIPAMPATPARENVRDPRQGIKMAELNDTFNDIRVRVYNLEQEQLRDKTHNPAPRDPDFDRNTKSIKQDITSLSNKVSDLGDNVVKRAVRPFTQRSQEQAKSLAEQTKINATCMERIDKLESLVAGLSRSATEDRQNFETQIEMYGSMVAEVRNRVKALEEVNEARDWMYIRGHIVKVEAQAKVEQD